MANQPSLLIATWHDIDLISANDASSRVDVEADAQVLERLFNHLISYGDNYSVSISWGIGDLIIFDQTSTMHKGSFNYEGHRRELHRIFISGEKTEMYWFPGV